MGELCPWLRKCFLAVAKTARNAVRKSVGATSANWMSGAGSFWRNPTGSKGGTETTGLAREGHQGVPPAFRAMHPHKTVGQDPAFQEAPELALYETGQVPSTRRGGELGQEALEMLQQEPVEKRSFRGTPAVTPASGFPGRAVHPVPTGVEGPRLRSRTESGARRARRSERRSRARGVRGSRGKYGARRRESGTRGNGPPAGGWRRGGSSGTMPG